MCWSLTMIAGLWLTLAGFSTPPPDEGDGGGSWDPNLTETTGDDDGGGSWDPN